jgi:hypothetical protein
MVYSAIIGTRNSSINRELSYRQAWLLIMGMKVLQRLVDSGSGCGSRVGRRRRREERLLHSEFQALFFDGWKSEHS